MGVIRSGNYNNGMWSSTVVPLYTDDTVPTGYTGSSQNTVNTSLLTNTEGVFTQDTLKPTTVKSAHVSGMTSVDDIGITTLSWDDATWILTSSFIIFTMQTGFGLIEAGSVNAKNEVNIMVKNAIDVVFGGLSYWAFGFGLSFGTDKGSNPFCGIGYWFVESRDQAYMGQLYSTFIFQLSFATTATTIVSGAMAERTRLRAYIVFSLLNTVIYCIPAHWVWAHNGFLKTLGCVDVAGSGVVHLLGAGSAFTAAWILGPRTGRYDEGHHMPEIGNGTNAMIGMFMLWWGWLAFNSGSTFGISGKKWILAARAAVVTLNGSMGGGVMAIIFTSIKSKGQLLIPDLIIGTLGSLVSVTGSCALIQPWEAVVIGALGGLFCCTAPLLMDRLKVDDPVGAVAVHGVGGLWGMIAVGLFVDVDPLANLAGDSRGLIHGGGFYLLGVQLLSCVIILAWSMSLTWIMLFAIKHTIGLRLSEWDEHLGSDFVEHGIHLEDFENISALQSVSKGHPSSSAGRRSSTFGCRKSSKSPKRSHQLPYSLKRRHFKHHVYSIEDKEDSGQNGFSNGVTHSIEDLSVSYSDKIQTSLTDTETAGLY